MELLGLEFEDESAFEPEPDPMSASDGTASAGGLPGTSSEETSLPPQPATTSASEGEQQGEELVRGVRMRSERV